MFVYLTLYWVEKGDWPGCFSEYVLGRSVLCQKMEPSPGDLYVVGQNLKIFFFSSLQCYVNAYD